MFQSADPYKLPPRSLAASISLHAAAITLLCVVGFPNSSLHRRVFHEILLAPSPERSVPAPHRDPPPPPPRKFAAPLDRALEAPPKLVAPVALPPAPVLDPPPAPLPVAVPAPAIAPLPAIPPILPPVTLGTFETADAKTAIEPVSRTKPRLAGFGAAETSATNAAHRELTSTGAFDPALAASGSATRGVLAKASGFGDAQTASAGASRAVIARSNFGDTTVATPARLATAVASAPVTPVEILDKPRPAYTGEARRLRIQGEVLLEIAFEASGQIRVLRVIRGLGHGLDETAAAAARQIHFRPALREGQPVDSSAVVHILFQLAD